MALQHWLAVQLDHQRGPRLGLESPVAGAAKASGQENLGSLPQAQLLGLRSPVWCLGLLPGLQVSTHHKQLDGPPWESD